MYLFISGKHVVLFYFVAQPPCIIWSSFGVFVIIGIVGYNNISIICKGTNGKGFIVTEICLLIFEKPIVLRNSSPNSCLNPIPYL